MQFKANMVFFFSKKLHDAQCNSCLPTRRTMRNTSNKKIQVWNHSISEVSVRKCVSSLTLKMLEVNLTSPAVFSKMYFTLYPHLIRPEIWKPFLHSRWALLLQSNRLNGTMSTLAIRTQKRMVSWKSKFWGY